MKFFHPSDDKTPGAPGGKNIFHKYPTRSGTVPPAPRNSEPSNIVDSSQIPTLPTSSHTIKPSNSSVFGLSASNIPFTEPEVQDIIRHTAADQDLPPQFRKFRISVDHKYLDLIYYNLYRALEVNTDTLGLTTFALTLDILSPFNSMTLEDCSSDPSQEAMSPAIPSQNQPLNLPLTLQPTYTQVNTPHHPYIDIFPSPKLRDNLIRAGDTIDDMELCFDIMGSCWEKGHGFAGLIVWGDPWDPYGWEVTEHFLEKWRWMFDGVEDVLIGTNYWRRLRGLKELGLEP